MSALVERIKVLEAALARSTKRAGDTRRREVAVRRERDALLEVERSAREVTGLFGGVPGRWTLADEEVQEEAATALLSLHDHLNDVVNARSAAR